MQSVRRPTLANCMSIRTACAAAAIAKTAKVERPSVFIKEEAVGELLGEVSMPFLGQFKDLLKGCFLIHPNTAGFFLGME